MTRVSSARKPVTWHAIVLILDASIVTIMDMSQWITLQKYHLQAHWHEAEITTLADMTDQHHGIRATPGIPHCDHRDRHRFSQSRSWSHDPQI